MDTNRLIKNVICGVSALIGFMVAEGVYRTGISALNKRELIGDGEVLSDEIEDTDNDINDNISF